MEEPMTATSTVTLSCGTKMPRASFVDEIHLQSYWTQQQISSGCLNVVLLYQVDHTPYLVPGTSLFSYWCVVSSEPDNLAVCPVNTGFGLGTWRSPTGEVANAVQVIASTPKPALMCYASTL